MERNKERNFLSFIRCLSEAGKCMNDAHYFQLPISGQEIPVFRERVYCYELYHQIRNKLGDVFPCKLDGEVDKSGHQFMPGKMKPDFIVHVPNDMDQNLAVIEVKPVTAYEGELESDLEKLEWLIKRGNYFRGIMLVYGNGEKGLPHSFPLQTKKFSDRNQNKILLAWHKGPNSEIRIV